MFHKAIRINLLTWLIGLIFLANVASIQAGSFNLPSHGGIGGYSYNISCEDNKVLVGVNVILEGSRLSKIQGHCVRLTANQGSWVGEISRTLESAQNPGGNLGDFSRICPSNTVVKGIRGSFNSSVSQLVLVCRHLLSSNNLATISVGNLEVGDQSFGFEACPSNKPVRGFHGLFNSNSGGRVVRSGLICHSDSTPILQLLGTPNNILATNLNDAQDNPSNNVRIQWIDNSSIESGYRIIFQKVGTSQIQIVNRLPVSGIGSLQTETLK